jgi:tRNA threonylcarbamoyladenosine biosynthesis protein TsaB
MIVLGFDTATSATVVGLMLEDGRTLQARDDPAGKQRPGHATRLLPLANDLLAEAGLRWSELERIAVGVGPGTFTGLRIGIATARGLAQSLGVELIGVSSLRALAHETRSVGGVLAGIDARRGEVFVAGYRGDREVLAPQPVSPHGLGDLLGSATIDTSAEHWTAVGDGAVLYRDAFEQLGVSVPAHGSPCHRIQASAICSLGSHQPICSPESVVASDRAAVGVTDRGATAGSATVLPDYRRRPDAEVALDRAVPDGAAQDGTAHNGAAHNGAAQDGAALEGAV